jgi:hypothetical protein
MLLSALSWMHWSRRRQARLALQQRQQEDRLLLMLQGLLEAHRLHLQQEQRALLWEMALPLAEALQRLDQRILVSQRQQVELGSLQEELLLEILQGQMTPVYQQLGMSTPPPSHPSWVS